MRTSPFRPVAMVAALALSLVVVAAGGSPAGAAPSQEATTSQETIAGIARFGVGATHACGVDDTKTLYCWGSDASGQLGADLSPGEVFRRVPIAVETAGTPLAGKDIAEVEAGYESTCARATDDTLACWGLNDLGQGGDGTTTDTDVPTAVTVAGTPLDGADIVDIDMQYKHVCALTATGVVACWGLGSVGQLGNGASANVSVPTAVSTTGTALDGKAVAQIATGAFSTCAVTTDADLTCWGSATRGGLGNGTTATNINTPMTPTTAGTPLDGKEVAQVTVGRYGACASTTVGDLACWGAGSFGQVGNGADLDVSVPTAATLTGTVLAGATITGMDSGFDHHCAVASNGNAACWGQGSYLGSGTADSANVPTGLAVGATVLDGVALDQIRTGNGGGCANGPGRQPGCWGSGNVRGAGGTHLTYAPTTLALRYTAPVDAPPITSLTADGSTVFLEWSGVTDDGGAEVSDIKVDVYVDGSIVDTDTYTGYSAGPGSVAVGGEYDTTYQVTIAAGNAAGFGPTSALSAPVTTDPPPATQSAYTAITPCRVVDTREAGGRFTDREIRDYTVTGDDVGTFEAQGGKAGGCGIPAGVEAVEASVTAVGPLDSGFFRAWPQGESVPNATFMNFDQGMDITNTGAITINSQAVADNVANGGAASEMRARNYGGDSHYVIDIQGYYGNARGAVSASAVAQATPSHYVPITPCRIVDTRQAGGVLGNREIRDVTVTGDGPAFAAQGGVAGGCDLPEGSVAVEASVTAVGPATSGFFRAWPQGESVPNATFMNFDQGMDITNTGALTINPEDPSTQLRIRNYGGASHYVLDIQGYFTGGRMDDDDVSAAEFEPAASYVAITPCRIVDTRQAGGTLENREIRNIQVGGTGDAFTDQGGTTDGCGVPTDAVAVEASVTAVGPADSGFFRAWPFGESVPNATFMNFDQGMDITNTGSLTIEPGDAASSGALSNALIEQLRIRNYGGSSHYVIDIQGYFITGSGE